MILSISTKIRMFFLEFSKASRGGKAKLKDSTYTIFSHSWQTLLIKHDVHNELNPFQEDSLSRTVIIIGYFYLEEPCCHLAEALT
jgi:hypothetical protein